MASDDVDEILRNILRKTKDFIVFVTAWHLVSTDFAGFHGTQIASGRVSAALSPTPMSRLYVYEMERARLKMERVSSVEQPTSGALFPPSGQAWVQRWRTALA